MHPYMHDRLAAARAEDLQRRSAKARRAGGLRATGAPLEGDVVIRRATESDRPTLALLAALDGAPYPLGEMLIAEVDGEPRAALDIDTGGSFADPFRRTREVVALLELRAAQVCRRAAAARTRRSRLVALTPALLRRLI